MINIRLNLQLTNDRVLLEFGLEVAVNVHGQGVVKHLTVDAADYFHFVMMVLANYSVSMQWYSVMETLDWNQYQNHDHEFDR